VVVADDLENLPFTAHYADAVLWEGDEGREAAEWAAGGRPVVGKIRSEESGARSEGEMGQWPGDDMRSER
jgi:hypothetical protein